MREHGGEDESRTQTSQATGGPSATPRAHPGRQDRQSQRLPFLIRRDGRWLYRGSLIGRKLRGQLGDG